MLKFEKWKILLVLAICLIGPIYAFPNLLNEDQREKIAASMPFLPHQAMSLGLDLQGGSHLQLQVDMKTVVNDRLENLTASARNILRDKKIASQSIARKGDDVVVTLNDAATAKAASTALRNEIGEGVTINNDGPVISITHTAHELASFKRQAMAQSIEIIRRRVDETGTKEPLIQAQGDDRIIVQLPGMKDPQHVKDLIGKTARLTFHMVDINVASAACTSGKAPLTVRCLPMARAEDGVLAVQRRALLTGDMLVDARAGFDQGGTGEPIVSFRLDNLGARKFADITRRNTGKPFAIVLDDVIITAPRINGVIPNGSGQITGNFTTESANDLAVLLRAGALPAPLKVIEERTVGPSLGADSINSGKHAAIAATLLVMALMFVVYGARFGGFINIALIVNVVLMIAILSIMGATLTLPGIVGIVLTIGVAVDANILIFERMREEMRAGRSVLPTIDQGFQGAMSSILDANITTLIAAVVLFLVGTGPVRGFAVTLMVGIITSLFASLFLTRLMIVTWVNWRKPKSLPL
ncbi:MAG: secD [Alphaproteobacteria bacterium]|nr:secD [Alphaproteobacteria bacterium]